MILFRILYRKYHKSIMKSVIFRDFFSKFVADKDNGILIED